jgi:hypothetical protein
MEPGRPPAAASPLLTGGWKSGAIVERLGSPADYLSLPPLDRWSQRRRRNASGSRGSPGSRPGTTCSVRRPGRGDTEVRHPPGKGALPPLEETYARAGPPSPRCAIRVDQAAPPPHHAIWPNTMRERGVRCFCGRWKEREKSGG